MTSSSTSDIVGDLQRASARIVQVAPELLPGVKFHVVDTYSSSAAAAGLVPSAQGSVPAATSGRHAQVSLRSRPGSNATDWFPDTKAVRGLVESRGAPLPLQPRTDPCSRRGGAGGRGGPAMRLRRPAIAATTLGLAGALLPASGAAAAEPADRHVVYERGPDLREGKHDAVLHGGRPPRLDLRSGGPRNDLLRASTDIQSTPGKPDCVIDVSFQVASVTMRWLYTRLQDQPARSTAPWASCSRRSPRGRGRSTPTTISPDRSESAASTTPSSSTARPTASGATAHLQLEVARSHPLGLAGGVARPPVQDDGDTPFVRQSEALPTNTVQSPRGESNP